MISVRGLSLETATRRGFLGRECVVVVLIMRFLTELSAARRWAVRCGQGFIASAEEAGSGDGGGGFVSSWEDIAVIMKTGFEKKEDACWVDVYQTPIWNRVFGKK